MKNPVSFSHQFLDILVNPRELVFLWSKGFHWSMLIQHLEKNRFSCVPGFVNIITLLNLLPGCSHHVLLEYLPVTLVKTSCRNCANWWVGAYHSFGVHQHMIPDTTRNYPPAPIIFWMCSCNDINESLRVTGDPSWFCNRLSESIII